MVEDKGIKYMSVKEFRALGFLQEINRRILHPAGLALEVQRDEFTGKETLGGIWDSRDDPEGIMFADGVMSLDKTVSVDRAIGEKEGIRLERFGWVVQPPPEE